MQINNLSILTASAMTDSSTGIVTAFINEIPAIVVQGSSEQDATLQLQKILDSYGVEAGSENLKIVTRSTWPAK